MMYHNLKCLIQFSSPALSTFRLQSLWLSSCCVFVFFYIYVCILAFVRLSKKYFSILSPALCTSQPGLQSRLLSSCWRDEPHRSPAPRCCRDSSPPPLFVLCLFISSDRSSLCDDVPLLVRSNFFRFWAFMTIFSLSFWELNADWCWFMLIAVWCWLMLIGAGLWWLMLIDADWCWCCLMMIDADGCWLMVFDAD